MSLRDTREWAERSGVPGAAPTAWWREGDGDADTSLSDSEVFEVLRNERRRVAIAHLLDADGPVAVRELTRRVAGEEYGIDPGAVSPAQHKRVYTGLHQCHLPRLDDFGVVEFDAEAGTVSLGDAVGAVEPHLARERGREWVVYLEVAVACLVAGLVIPGVFGVGALGAVPVTWWAALTAVALSSVAGVHLAR